MDDIKNLHSGKGFNELYERLIKESKTGKEAYEKAERIFIAKFNHRKYSSHLSFRVSRSRYYQ